MTLHFLLYSKGESEQTTPVNSLTITQQPSNQTVVVGDSAVFTLTISGGVAPYRYLWQGLGTQWNNLRDVTNSSLTDSYTYATNPPTAGQQRTVRCVITDAENTTIESNSVTLDVTASPAPVTSQVTLSSSSPYTYSFSSGGVSDPQGTANINWNELTLISGASSVKRSDQTPLVTAQGSWSMSTANPPTVTFTPAGSFTSGSTSVSYYVKDIEGNTSNSSLMNVTVNAGGGSTLRIVPVPPETYQRPGISEVDAYITNRSQLNAFMNGSGVSAILANGEYLQGQPAFTMAGKTNKKLWAENQHQASFAWADFNDASANGARCISCAGASYIELHGLRMAHGRYYGLVMSGDTNYINLPSHHILASHVLIEEQYMGGVKMDNGTNDAPPAYKSHHLTFQYSIIRNVGRQWPSDSSPYFCEGIYVGSGSVARTNDAIRSAYDWQGVEDLLILKNLIQPNTTTVTYDNRVSGEAIEIKVGCKNVSIIGNDLENTRLGLSTSGSALAVHINSYEGDPGTFLIEGNRIRNVQRTTEPGIWSAANGIVLGTGAIIRNNIITGCQNQGIRFQMNTAVSNGVFPSNAAYRQVLIEHNTIVGNQAAFASDPGQGPAPIVTLRGNLLQDTNYPSPWSLQSTNDVVPNLSQLVGSTFTPSTLAAQSELRPINDSTLTYSGTSSVAYDINGNVRPFGANKHYGASEA